MVNKKEEIIYPFFLKISQKMKDSYWRFLYEDLSIGKFPSGIFISNNYLCSIRRGKEFSYKINNISQYHIEDEEVEKIHLMLKDKAGIYSEMDKVKEKEKILMKMTKLNIAKKHYRNNLIEEYVISRGATYELDKKLQRKIYNFIKIGIIFKTIKLENFTFAEDQSISEIDGINFKKGEIKILYENLFSSSSQINMNFTKKKYKKYNIESLWRQFIDHEKTL